MGTLWVWGLVSVNACVVYIGKSMRTWLNLELATFGNNTHFFHPSLLPQSLLPSLFPPPSQAPLMAHYSQTEAQSDYDDWDDFMIQLHQDEVVDATSPMGYDLFTPDPKVQAIYLDG